MSATGCLFIDDNGTHLFQNKKKKQRQHFESSDIQQNNEEETGTLAPVRGKWDNDKAAEDNQTNIPWSFIYLSLKVALAIRVQNISRYKMLPNLSHFPVLLVLAGGCAIIQASSATVNNPLQQRQLTEFPLKSTQRFCEGGHRCTVPKECCHLGCCYPPYAPPNPPKTPSSPVTDHVLNLFLVNHWYFWLVHSPRSRSDKLRQKICEIICDRSWWRIL